MKSIKDVLDMNIFETMNVSLLTQVQRIPGGWIYTTYSNQYTEQNMSSVFVEYDAVANRDQR